MSVELNDVDGSSQHGVLRSTGLNILVIYSEYRSEGNFLSNDDSRVWKVKFRFES